MRSGLEGQDKGCMQEGDEQTLLPEEAELVCQRFSVCLLWPSDTNRINKLIEKAPSIIKRHQKTVNKHVIHYPSTDNRPPSPTHTSQTAEHHFNRHQNQAGHLVLTPDSIGQKTAGGPQDLRAETSRNCTLPLVESLQLSSNFSCGHSHAREGAGFFKEQGGWVSKEISPQGVCVIYDSEGDWGSACMGRKCVSATNSTNSTHLRPLNCLIAVCFSPRTQ